MLPSYSIRLNRMSPFSAGRTISNWLLFVRWFSDLDFGIEIIGAPTVREPDGLAMSSRNNYLTSEHRISALSLYKSLQKAKELIKSGVQDAATIIDTAKELIQSYPETDIDYIAICDTETLADIQTIDRPVQMVLAVQVGKARLIDNMLLNP